MKHSIAVAIAITLAVTILNTNTQAAPKGSVSSKLIEHYESDLRSQGNTKGTINAVTNNDIKALSLDREKLITHNRLFSHKLKSAGITNQKSSGRCWLFACLNVFSLEVKEQLKLDKFEFSQPFLTFWDKIEKANLFLEEIIAYRDDPINDRIMQIIIDSPIGDGGWWAYATALIDKYGIVPLSAMPETKQSIKTGRLNRLATTKLLAFASELRQMHVSGESETDLRKRKDEMLSEIYQMLVYTYGPPPKKFTFRFESKDSTISDEPKEYTPESFRDKFLGKKTAEYVALIDNPTREYGKLYQIESSRNMYEAKDILLLNLPVSRLKYYTQKALLDSQAVWFACDVGKENYSDSGVFMTGIYDYNTTFGIDFSLSKAERITFQDMSPNHAMVLMGVDTTSDGQTIKWLVENSWGEKKGDKGFWYMYDEWFNEYVLLTIIDKKLIEPDDLRKLKQEPIKIPIWDPFFLALRKLNSGGSHVR